MTELINCVAPDDLSQYKNVMVYLEHREGHLVRGSVEMLGMASKLASKVNEKVVGVALGSDLEPVAQDATQYGCDIFLGAESKDLSDFRSVSYSRIISEYILKEKPNILLVSGTREGRDLVSRIAILTKTGVAADCVELDIQENDRLLVAWRPSFGDKTIDQILCKRHRPQTITSRPGSYPLPEKDTEHKCDVKITKVTLPKEETAHRVLMKKEKTKLDLTSKKIIVSGGLGLGGKDGFKLIGELASVLGGEVGASRPVVDLGWIPYEHQVGQTGQTVRPKLYIAAGISGKIQHIVGMKNSEIIVSINTDPSAEIVKYSDYFINSDLYKAIPRIIESVKTIVPEAGKTAQKSA